jgi:hypothetical protein
MYQRIILPFQMDMELFNSSLVKRNKADYDELTRQIFQVMILDLNAYRKCLSVLPHIPVLLNNPSLDEVTNCREIYLRYALNIYFTCFEYKLFDNGVFNHLLEHINEDSFILYCCEPLNF